MPIIPISPNDDALIAQMADLLVVCFAEHWPHAWPDHASGLEEVRDLLAEGFALAQVDEAGRVQGFIGGLPQYDGHVWELHPLAVHPDLQGQGIGRVLIAAFEAEVARRGGLTIFLGTDDEDEMTSLAQVDLYDDLPRHLREIRNLKRHPFGFYQKMGYTIVGVVPDANGPGKPDILMAKRVRR